MDRPSTPTKRVYTAAYKQRILREVDLAVASGEQGAAGALLRREGLYWAAVSRWRKERDRAEMSALAPKKRGRKPTRDAAASEIERLRRQVERLEGDLHKAHVIIDVQKKLSDLLGVEMPPIPEDDETR